MIYPKSYFEDEVRDGFLVPSIMKRCWACGKSLYDELDEICQKKEINGFADGGTVLGAIRHGGFVPWDDDIDVAFGRGEYKKFLEAVQDRNEYSIGDFSVNKNENLGLTRCFTKRSSLFVVPDDWWERFGFPFYNVLDVFIYDYIPRNKDERTTYIDILEFFWGVSNLAKKVQQDIDCGEADEEERKILQGYLRKIEEIFGITFREDSSIAIQLMMELEKICENYTAAICDEQIIVYDWYVRRNRIFKNQAFAFGIDMPFENGTVRIPVGYDEILRKIYLNYMVPQMAWDGHGYPYFDDLEDELLQKGGGKLLRYEFSEKDVLVLQNCQKRERGIRANRVKEIVFLVYKTEYWKYLHSLYEEAVRAEDVTVVVLAVPYYYRNFDNKLETEMQLETEGYPKSVKLTPYEEYDFAERNPYAVIYQFPYDNYSYALSWHPDFYISNIRKYVDKLIFIPPFVLREIDDRDSRSRYTLKWFLNTPGLIYADKIFVQSQKMKEVYEEILSNFTRECDAIDWKERIYATGLPYWDWQSREKTILENEPEVPDEWLTKLYKEDRTRKKILLYYVNGSVLYEHKWKMLNKIRNFFEICRKMKDDILVVWYIDPYTEEILSYGLQTIWSSYCSLIEQFETENLGVVVDGKEYAHLAKLCDAIYGDGGVIMTKCREEHKPVLFETPELSVEQENDYVYKKWTDDVQVAVEGEWSLQNILQEMMEYKYEVPAKDCGRRIWEEIISGT